MIPQAIGILTASLLGSVHCAAMCGGFVCLYSGSTNANASLVRAHALYNVGRLISYVLLGAAAGALGVGVTHMAAFANISSAAPILAGALMIAWGLNTIAGLYGIKIVRSTRVRGLSPWFQRTLGGALYHVREQPVAVRALLTGVATTLLPCGWLYVFVAAAGGTGHIIDGMVLMSIFWLGTVPALVAVGMGAQRVFGPLRQRLPAVGAFAVLVMGVLAVSGRLMFSTGAMSGMLHVR